MRNENVNILGMQISIMYDPAVPGSWEHAVASAVMQGECNVMAKTCTKTSGMVGDPVTLRGSGSSGTPPFTIIFKKDGTELTRFTGVPAGTLKEYIYTLAPGDAGTRRFSQEITDAAGKPCSEFCDVVVSAPGPACNFEVT